MTSRLGTGKWQTFFYSVQKHLVTLFATRQAHHSEGAAIFLSLFLREAGLPTSRNQAPPGTLVVYNGHIKSETLRAKKKLRHPEAYKKGDDSSELQPATSEHPLHAQNCT